MAILWDSIKNDLLIATRNISFEEICEKIINKEYADIIENPVRENQQYFILSIRDYTWLVPCMTDEDDNIILKTAFPSRKFHRIYGGST